MKKAKSAGIYVVYVADGDHWKLRFQTRDKDVAIACIDKHFLWVKDVIGLMLNGINLDPFLLDSEMQKAFKDPNIIQFFPKQPGDQKCHLRIVGGNVLGLPKKHSVVLAGRFGQRMDSEHFLLYKPGKKNNYKSMRYACGHPEHLKNGHKILRVTHFKKDGTLIIKLQDGVFHIPGDGSSPTFMEKPVYPYHGQLR